MTLQLGAIVLFVCAAFWLRACGVCMPKVAELSQLRDSAHVYDGLARNLLQKGALVPDETWKQCYRFVYNMTTKFGPLLFPKRARKAMVQH